jgi:hypothetical protein
MQDEEQVSGRRDDSLGWGRPGDAALETHRLLEDGKVGDDIQAKVGQGESKDQFQPEHKIQY